MIRTASVAADATTTSVDVLIVGAGPTGLTLAVGLAAQGVRAHVVDGLPEGVNTSRAAVIHARTLEVLEPLGVASELTSLGSKVSRFTIRDRDRVLMPLRFDELPTAYPYTLMLPQPTTERVLLERLRALGGDVERQVRLAALAQDADGVSATMSNGKRVRARYVIGTDGMHSTVRELVGIAFDGAAYGESFVLADARLEGVPSDEVMLWLSSAGMAVVAPLPGGVHRIVAVVDEAPETPSSEFLESPLRARGPQDSPPTVRDVTWGTRFRVHHRIARTYRAGRVVLAGDAAHVHSPAGGQGMNAGIIDGARLAEALVAALKGDEHALAAYESERRPIAKDIVSLADRLTRMATVPQGLRGLRNLVLSVASRLPAVRRTLAWKLSGLAYR